ncbi:MAG TPA: hypothetical protein DCE41_31555 [Cytophagales bacterium]|nr:hypothetical protein [Cytophagales bacterium]HAA18989.1 hypothetical protein [Cytophagales bacterium]HAP61834.1 hypothetical protein [Cytophagales bacterium]
MGLDFFAIFEAMEILEKAHEGVVVLQPEGKLTIVEGATVLYDHVKKSLGSGNNRIVFNLSAVPLLDSTGIGQIISSYTAIQKSSGKLVLASLQPKTKEVLKITRLYEMFTVTDTVEEAVNALK